MKKAISVLFALTLTTTTYAAEKTASQIGWSLCPDNNGECATVQVPRDYKKPRGERFNLALVRFPATQPKSRIGVLFINFGGPGGSAVTGLKFTAKVWFSRLNERFDLIGFDPRGVGATTPAIDCQVNQEAQGLYAQPLTTPQNFSRRTWIQRAKTYVDSCKKHNPGVLPHINTANVARDMDTLRRLLGENQISYLGYSYGTYLGATYAALFPGRYRAMLLDGAVDPAMYANSYRELLTGQSAGFDRAMGRFFESCAFDQAACAGFGEQDPSLAFDGLVRQADLNPLPAYGENPVPVDGDDMVFAATNMLYQKRSWPWLARALAQASEGDGTQIRELVDIFYGRKPDGTYDPVNDSYFMITAADQRLRGGIKSYAIGGYTAWQSSQYAWWINGYNILPYRYMNIDRRSAFIGPFNVDSTAAPILVIGTTYDPATPYRWAISMVDQLGNARLLTRDGDGHCAYPKKSACIDNAVESYLETLALPPLGTWCSSEERFEQPTVKSGIASSMLPPPNLWGDEEFLRVLRGMR